MKQYRSTLLTMLFFWLLALCGSMAPAFSESVQYTNVLKSGRMLIVISAPSIDDPYYTKNFRRLINFDIRFAKAIMGHDNVVVLAEKKVLPYFKGKLPDDILLEAEVLDIWIRDFSPAHPRKMVLFSYDRPAEPEIQKSFKAFARENRLRFKNNRLKIDGGNVVDNGADKIVLTKKIFERNPHLSKQQITRQLKSLLGVEHIAFIPMDEEFLGHSDGMVMFAERNTLLVNNYPEDPAFTRQVIAAVKPALPNVNIVKIEGDGYGENIGNYASACGLYVNSVVTNNFIYTPIFGRPKDRKALNTIRHNTNKRVITVNAKHVCRLGGSLRCLSWQLTGNNANKLIQAARIY
ncbi:MAG: agmatine deiminase family protein [bacterium]|nr:agmatine deiminase family protein [bacterium]